MKNYYADFLQSKIFENIQGKAVSKVSKGQNAVSKQAFDTFDTSLPSKNQKNLISETGINTIQKTVEDTTSLALTSRINRLISEGVKFEICADAFFVFGVSDRERRELEANRAGVLCTLQQMFLQKHLFNHSPELFEDFQTKVYERSAIRTDGGAVVFEAVAEVCAEWITDALEKLNAGCVL